MREGRKSTVGEAAPEWQQELDDGGEGEGAFCRRHASSSQLPYSVCAFCLRDRLLRLCPDCAGVRPCACPCQPSTSAASSTASSSLSSSYGSSRTATIQFVNGSGSDKMSNLIASEPAFVRSKSAGFALRRDGSVKRGLTGLERSRSVAVGGEERRKRKRWNWAAIWPFKGLTEKGEEKVEKWKWWYFPSPIRGFNYRKSASRAAVVV